MYGSHPNSLNCAVTQFIAAIYYFSVAAIQELCVMPVDADKSTNNTMKVQKMTFRIILLLIIGYCKAQLNNGDIQILFLYSYEGFTYCL